MEKGIRRTLYLDENTDRILNMKGNKSDYVNKAVKFYNSYEIAEENNDFILKGVDEIVKAKLDKFEYDFSKRAFKLLSNLGIEVGILTYLLSNISKLDDEVRNTIRLKVIDELEDTNSVYKYNK